MEQKNIKTVGILGGMGPEATVDLLHRIIAHTGGDDDADHVRCLVDQNPKIPSRIKYLLEGGDISPAPCLIAMAKNLEAAGADFICMACNTAHNWHKDVAEAVCVPVLNIIEITSANAAKLVENLPPQKRLAGVMASPAVRITGLYENPCRKNGLTPLYADEDMEKKLLEVIKAVKAGSVDEETHAIFSDVIRHFENKGAAVLLVACTELGTLDFRTSLPVVDAADALAITIVNMAGAKLI